MGSLTVVVLTFAVLIPICFGGPAYHEGQYKKKYSHDMSYDKKGYKKYDDYDKKPSYPRGFGRRGDVQLARDLVLLKMAMDMYGGKHDDHGYGYDYKKKDYKKKDYDYDYKKKDYDYNDYKKKDDYNDYDKKDYKKKDYGASNSYQYGGPGHFGGPGGGPGFHGGHWGGPFGGGPGFSGGAAGRFGGQFHHPHGQWVCKCKPYCNMFNEINAGVCPKFPIWKICCKWIPIKPHKPYDKKYDDKKYDDKHYHKKYDDKKYDNKHYDKKYDDKKYDDKKYDKKYYGSGHQHHYGHGPGYSGYQSSYGPGYGRYQSSYGPGYGRYQSSYGPGYSGGLSSSYKSTYGSTYSRPY